MTDGSLRTIPRRGWHTTVFAVPRSIPKPLPSHPSISPPPFLIVRAPGAGDIPGSSALAPLRVLAEQPAPAEVEPVLLAIGRERHHLRVPQVGVDARRGDAGDPGRVHLDHAA